MPIYEYVCNKCGHEFELLVFNERTIRCQNCNASEVTKKLSSFGMSGVEKPFAGSSSGCTSCSKTSCSSCK